MNVLKEKYSCDGEYSCVGIMEGFLRKWHLSWNFLEKEAKWRQVIQTEEKVCVKSWKMCTYQLVIYNVAWMYPPIRGRVKRRVKSTKGKVLFVILGSLYLEDHGKSQKGFKQGNDNPFVTHRKLGFILFPVLQTEQELKRNWNAYLSLVSAQAATTKLSESGWLKNNGYLFLKYLSWRLEVQDQCSSMVRWKPSSGL